MYKVFYIDCLTDILWFDNFTLKIMLDTGGVFVCVSVCMLCHNYQIFEVEIEAECLVQLHQGRWEVL